MNAVTPRSPAPRAILAHADPAYAALALRALRLRGWDVRVVRTGVELRRLAGEWAPELVILDADLPGESGWLTCEKLTRTLAPVRVILVEGETDPYRHDFALFCGATALVNKNAGVLGLVEGIDVSPNAAIQLV